jgi:hypothetical protein
MEMLLTMSTRPYYAQVALFDETVEDAYPEWEDGNAAVATTTAGVAVATQPDHLGQIDIEVVAGSRPEDAELEEVWGGSIEVRDDRGLLVGSGTGADLKRVPVSPGRHEVRVFVSRRGDRVRFWLSEHTMS